MKKIIWVLIVLSATLGQRGYGQDTTAQKQLSALLGRYYNLKNALVASDAGKTATEAGEYIKTLNGIPYQVISEGNANTLLRDATAISESKDVARQRANFANLSKNMISLAKSLKLSTAPIYEAYCPMKKSSWLSAEKVIKNPYYGNAMLSCGSIVETINQ